MRRSSDETRDPSWVTVAVALAAVAIQLPIFDRWIALLDEGSVLAIADDIERGSVYCRDSSVGVDATLPGAFYLLAGWFRLAGSSVLSSRVLAVAGFALLATASFRSARALVPRAWACGLLALLLCYRTWAFPHWQSYSPALVSAALLSAAVALVMSFVGRGGAARVLGAGVLAGAAVMSQPQHALAVSGLLTLVLACDGVLRRAAGGTIAGGLRAALRFVAGAAIVVLPALAYLAWHGAPGDLVHQAFLVPPSGAPQLADARLSDATLQLVSWAPLLVTGGAALLWLAGVARRLASAAPADDPRRLEDTRRLVLLAWACGVVGAFHRPGDWVHLMTLYPPSLVVGAVLLERVARRLPRPAGLAFVSACALPVLVLCVVSALRMRELRADFGYALATPRAGVRVDQHDGPIFDELLAYVDANVPPGEPLPAYPAQPMLTFLAGRDAAGACHGIWPGQDPSHDDRIVADLERRRPSSIVYDLSQDQQLGTVRRNAPKLFAYLVEHYEIARVLAREPNSRQLTILRRRDGTAAGDSLLDHTAPGASMLTRARWPFADVLTQTVTLDTDPRPAFLRLRVPAAGGTLRLSYGVHPDRWLGLESGPFRFAIALLSMRVTDDRGQRRLVFEEFIDPARKVADRKWTPVEVSLDEFAGQEILLGFSVSTPHLVDAPSDLGGWAEPRLVPRVATR